VTLAREMTALRGSAGLSHPDHVAALELRGSGAFDLLELASSRPLHLREGQVRHALFLGDDARVVADVYIASAGDGFYVFGEGMTEAELSHWLASVRSERLASASVSIIPMSADHELVGVDGPYSWEVVAEVLGPAVLGIPYLTLLRRGDAVCMRAGKTGEYGYLLVAPRGESVALEQRLLDAGASRDLALVGRDALDLCALENGHFSMRAMRPTPLAEPLTPLELQLQWRVAYDKAFVGADALRARRAQGIEYRVTSFTAAGEIAAGDPIRFAGQLAGEVQAAGHSPTLGAWVGQALLARRLAHPHVDFAVDTLRGPIAITTRTAPMVDNLSLHVDPHKHAYATKGTIA
jgi:glycine cleavage system aminomethyltransferase T